MYVTKQNISNSQPSEGRWRGKLHKFQPILVRIAYSIEPNPENM